jgi:hypothetical protein
MIVFNRIVGDSFGNRQLGLQRTVYADMGLSHQCTNKKRDQWINKEIEDLGTWFGTNCSRNQGHTLKRLVGVGEATVRCSDL